MAMTLWLPETEAALAQGTDADRGTRALTLVRDFTPNSVSPGRDHRRGALVLLSPHLPHLNGRARRWRQAWPSHLL